MQFEVYIASDNEFGQWRCAQIGGGPADTIDIKKLGNYSTSKTILLNKVIFENLFSSISLNDGCLQ